MTEQSFPFGGTTVAEPPVPGAPTSVDDDSADKKNRQKLMAVGAAVTALVVLVAAFMLMRGGSSNTGDSVAITPHPAAGSTTTGAATTPAKGHKATGKVHLPKNDNSPVGHDPFKPLVSDQVAAPAAATDTTTTGTAAAPPTVTVPATTTDTTTTDTSGSTTTTAPTQTRHPVWVALAFIGKKGAGFDVGYGHRRSSRVVRYVVRTPQPGSPRIFAHDFALLRVNKDSVVVQFGDGSPFTLDSKNPLRYVG
jgi:hypothetical protein